MLRHNRLSAHRRSTGPPAALSEFLRLVHTGHELPPEAFRNRARPTPPGALMPSSVDEQPPSRPSRPRPQPAVGRRRPPARSRSAAPSRRAAPPPPPPGDDDDEPQGGGHRGRPGKRRSQRNVVVVMTVLTVLVAALAVFAISGSGSSGGG